MSTDSDLTALDTLVASPFARLKALLGDTPPGKPPITFALGEPQAPLPDFVPEVLNQSMADFTRYPPIAGTPGLRGAIAAWLQRRYPSLAGAVDAEKNLAVLNGSREGLFSAIFPARARKAVADPAVLVPNPFYQAYAAAAAAAGAEPVFLDCTAETGFLPDLDTLDEALLNRTIAFYLCSPSNPQGAVADAAYWQKAVRLARRHDFMLFADECYSEIYTGEPPAGALEAAFALDGTFDHVISFNSLSKRSGLPGVRSGFAAGDSRFCAAFSRFRNVAAPQTPLPLQAVAEKAWSDEAHVTVGRRIIEQNLDLADDLLAGRYGYQRPQGGFFLWLDMAQFGGGEAAAKTLWKECGVRVLPGGYLAHGDNQGRPPGSSYVRLALVHEAPVTEEGLKRIVGTLG
ncbi:aminotransferase class I/II-fold pyridoxal phosphate-dependent enzyme [Methyloligella sp. 2.7D]|uniref:aminotransferase class I/II-fold pyridoxal phosphate-dependent enzyme n=1 Tax=unclassified Methyloligella TaxID=2625955 RepID=UPI00157E0B3A|nr:aminotransferase class I/II-fold pyridoxal phosphate-dependent enzyme [Methyloligella sp. GL2]QKP76253.1 aminotransferase class I/II-fold pyridoxal phosphate-dependent enzyme [Methyloligella sp. GL2]